MKIIYISAITLLLISYSSRSLWGFDLLPPLVKKDTKITFHVVTDNGKPIKNILLYNWSQKGLDEGSPLYDKSSGTTCSNGVVTLSLPSFLGLCEYGVRNIPGYYSTGGNYQFTNSVGGKWQPWNPNVDVVVKPILNPIPMYAQAVRLSLPAKNTPVGFDLEAGDWIAPYGKGVASDFIFTLADKVPFVDPSQPYDVTNTISFSNKGDGIQSVIAPLNQGSALRLPRYDLEGGYQPTLVQELALNGNKRLNGADGEDQNYIFRVRSILDESGNVKSALYGKISGPILCGAQGYIQFTYYLNPTPNDRNMEFDPSKNLFQNLTDEQQVKAP